MSRSRVHDGVVFRRKESRVWWVRDRNGARRREPTQTEAWNEAQKKLRDRLQARDNNVLDVVILAQFWHSRRPNWPVGAAFALASAV